MQDDSDIKDKLPGWMKSRFSQGILTIVLWLASAGLSLYTLLETQQMFFRLYIWCCSENRWGFSILRQWSSIGIIGLWLAFTIISGEYHYQHVRESKSWRLFGWSFSIIILILLISMFLF